MATVTTVTFEDHGQDFLEWDIRDGQVIDSRPFQAWLWGGCRLLEPVEDLKAGGYVLIYAPSGLGPMRIKYPLESVRSEVR